MNKLETMKAMLAVLRDETAKSRQDIDDRAHFYFNAIENRLCHIEDVLTALIEDFEDAQPGRRHRRHTPEAVRASSPRD